MKGFCKCKESSRSELSTEYINEGSARTRIRGTRNGGCQDHQLVLGYGQEENDEDMKLNTRGTCLNMVLVMRIQDYVNYVF